jgi:hypothetical protein
MHKVFATICLLASLVLRSQEKDYSLAKVGVKVENIYIFMGATPVQEYNTIDKWQVYWNKEGKLDEKIQEAVTRAKKKYNNVDGIIFTSDGSTAEFIKFIGREITGGGFKSGEKVIYKDGRRIQYGEIAILDNTKQRASVKYLDPYGEEKTTDIPYEKLSVASKDDYQKNIELQNIEIQKHKFVAGEKVTWSEDNKPRYGEILTLNNVKHDAKINFLDKYGDAKTETLDYLKIEKADENKFKEYMSQQAIEIEKHKYILGETVSFVEDKVTKPAEVTALNPMNHKASIKYLNIYGEEKTKEIPYFDLEKISSTIFKEEVEKYKKEIAKYKFTAGEKANWSKGGTFKKSEIITCEILSLDDINHKAVIKYIDKENKEQQAKADYLDLTKVN